MNIQSAQRAEENPNLITLEEATDLIHEYGLVHLAMIMDRFADEIIVQAADLRELCQDDLDRFGDKTPSFARTFTPPSELYVIAHNYHGRQLCALCHNSERDERLFAL